MSEDWARDLLQRFLDKFADLEDERADDGDGRIDEWQSDELRELIKETRSFLGVSDKPEEHTTPQPDCLCDPCVCSGCGNNKLKCQCERLERERQHQINRWRREELIRRRT